MRAIDGDYQVKVKGSDAWVDYHAGEAPDDGVSAKALAWGTLLGLGAWVVAIAVVEWLLDQRQDDRHDHQDDRQLDHQQ